MNGLPVVEQLKLKLKENGTTAKLLALIPGNGDKKQLLAAEVSSIILDIEQDERLQQCTAESFIDCLKGTLSLGLRIGKSHEEMYLISASCKKIMDGKKAWVSEAQTRPGYPAYINLAFRDHGWIFTPELVCQEEIDKGLFSYDHVTQKIIHTWSPDLDTKVKDRTNIRFGYCMVRSQDGTFQMHTRPYTKEEIEQRGTQIRNGKACLGTVWHSTDRLTDYGEMFKKTLIIIQSKYLPSKSLRELAALAYSTSTEDNKIVTKTINCVTQQQAKLLEDKAKGLEDNTADIILTACGVKSFSEVPANQYAVMLNGIAERETKQSEQQKQAKE